MSRCIFLRLAHMKMRKRAHDSHLVYGDLLAPSKLAIHEILNTFIPS